MTLKELQKRLKDHSSEVKSYISRDLPRIVGTIAKNHFDDNFRKQGFVNGGLHPWPKRRIEAPQPILRSKRNHLSQNIRFAPGDRGVRIYNDTPYAAIHNEGGQYSVTQQITPKMRRFAWAQFYNNGGANGVKDVPKEAQMWRAMALKKGTVTRNIKMPKRQFMGESKELTEAINERIVRDFKKILK